MSALEWSQPFGSGSGRWSADTRAGGMDVEITVNGIHPGPRCPCAPGKCRQPGVPYVTVYAVPLVSLTAPGTSAWHRLACTEQGIHVADPFARPGGGVHALAVLLAVDAAKYGRAALRELAGHAARLGIQSEGAVTRG